MNNFNIRSPLDRLSFYYKYFGRKRDQGIVKLSSEEIREEFGFKSSTSIVRDINALVKKPARKNYGYNVTYIYNTLRKRLGLDVARNAYVIGPAYPFMLNEEYKRRNIIIHTESEPETIDFLIITEGSVERVTSIINMHPEIMNIYNFTFNRYQTGDIPVTNFDFLQMMLDAIIPHKMFYIEIGKWIYYVRFEENSSAAAFEKLLEKSSLTLPITALGEYNQSAALDIMLPQGNKAVTAQMCDIVLVDKMLIICCDDTDFEKGVKIGHIEDISSWEVLFDSFRGNNTITFSIN